MMTEEARDTLDEVDVVRRRSYAGAGECGGVPREIGTSAGSEKTSYVEGDHRARRMKASRSPNKLCRWAHASRRWSSHCSLNRKASKRSDRRRSRDDSFSKPSRVVRVSSTRSVSSDDRFCLAFTAGLILWLVMIPWPNNLPPTFGEFLETVEIAYCSKVR